MRHNNLEENTIKKVHASVCEKEGKKEGQKKEGGREVGRWKA